MQLWGTWRNFLQEVGEYTEASYHYPQGTHLGHILSILWFFGQPSRSGTRFDNRFLKMRGGLSEGRAGAYERQVKYKLQAAMELGILEDDRTAPVEGEFYPQLTAKGQQLLAVLKPALTSLDLRFPADAEGIPSTRMALEESEYNAVILQAAGQSPEARKVIQSVFLGMHAVEQMLIPSDRSPAA